MKRIFYLIILLFFLINFQSPALPTTPGTLNSSLSLKIGLMEEPKTLNPFSATDRWSKNIIKQLYQPLYIKGPKNLDIVPWLAVEKPHFNHTNEVIIHLKKAQWEDGTPLTADDIVFTGNIIKEFQIPSFYSDWDFIKGLKALNKNTIKFTLTEKKAIFFSQTMLTPIIQKKQWKPIVLKARTSKNPIKTLLGYQPKKIISSGPFRFSKWESGKYIKLIKNEFFFGQGTKILGYKIGPYINEIVFLIYRDINQMIDALKSGEIDYIWGSIEPRYLSQIRNNLKIYLTTSPMNAIQYLAFNLRKEPFNDKHFRQALAYLIDKDILVTNVLNNYGVSLDSIIPPGNTIWHNSETRKYGKDLSRKERIQKAMDLLESAGYKWREKPSIEKSLVSYGKGLLMPNGEPVPPFIILFPSFEYDPARAISARFIQEWWKGVGIPVEIKSEPFRSLMKRVKDERNFDVVILGWNLGIDPDYLRIFFHSREAVKYGKNFSGYKNLDFDRLADASAIKTDFKERKELIKKMEQIIIEEVPYIPLYSSFMIEVYRLDRFSGWFQQLNGIGNIWSLLLVKSLLPYNEKSEN